MQWSRGKLCCKISSNKTIKRTLLKSRMRNASGISCQLRSNVKNYILTKIFFCGFLLIVWSLIPALSRSVLKCNAFVKKSIPEEVPRERTLVLTSNLGKKKSGCLVVKYCLVSLKVLMKNMLYANSSHSVLSFNCSLWYIQKDSSSFI